MQQPPKVSLTDIGALVIAGLFIIGGTLLLYFGTLNFTEAGLLFGAALSIFGVQKALNVPSPAQQAILGANQQNLQQTISQVVSVLPMFASLLHSHGPVPPVPVAPQPQPPPVQQVAPYPQPVTPPVSLQSLQTQFRPSALPDISMPMNVVTPPGQQPQQ